MKAWLAGFSASREGPHPGWVGGLQQDWEPPVRLSSGSNPREVLERKQGGHPRST